MAKIIGQLKEEIEDLRGCNEELKEGLEKEIQRNDKMEVLIIYCKIKSHSFLLHTYMYKFMIYHHHQEILKIQDLEIRTQGQEIRRLSVVVTRHEAALTLDKQKWKLMETGKFNLKSHGIKKFKTKTEFYILTNVSDLMQNNTIEERVSLLEVQVADLREDVTVV